MGNWVPRWKHVTQWDPQTNSGDNNCAPASLTRLFMEYDPTTPGRMANSEWQLVRDIHNPNNPASVLDLIDRCSVIGRGYHSGPWNGFTSAEGIEHILDVFEVNWTHYYTENVGADAVTEQIRNSSMSIVWVSGIDLYPASCPSSFWPNNSWDHIILSLPDDSLVNDPLTTIPDTKTDVRYSWQSIHDATGGCWVVPAPENIKPTVYTIKANCALKKWPNHLGTPANSVVEQLTAHSVISLTGIETPNWSYVTAKDGKKGYILKDNIAHS